MVCVCVNGSRVFIFVRETWIGSCASVLSDGEFKRKGDAHDAPLYTWQNEKLDDLGVTQVGSGVEGSPLLIVLK